MKTIAPAGWIAILVFIATVAGCVAMIYIAQSNQWSPITSAQVTEDGETANAAASLQQPSQNIE